MSLYLLTSLKYDYIFLMNLFVTYDINENETNHISAEIFQYILYNNYIFDVI